MVLLHNFNFSDLPESLRFDGESESEFRSRAVSMLNCARALVEACIQNECVQQYLQDASLNDYTVEKLQSDPVVRVEYEQAIAIGDIAGALSFTRNKHWGTGPQVMPLKPDDWFFPDHYTYIYRENSLYNQRFLQRKRMKEILGKRWRKLVGSAKWHNQETFLRILKPEEARAIRRNLNVGPKLFWRMAKGSTFVPLKPAERQLDLPFLDPDRDEAKH